MSFAKAVITGTLIADPEKRFTPNNHAVTTLTIAVENTSGFNRAGTNAEPFLVRVTCWRGIAEAVATKLCKGDIVLVEGKLMMNSYQTQDGLQKKSFELEAVTVHQLPGKPEALLGEGMSEKGQNISADSSVQESMPNRFTKSDTAEEVAPLPAPAMMVQPSMGHFSSEDLLTEDDIPF